MGLVDQPGTFSAPRLLIIQLNLTAIQPCLRDHDLSRRRCHVREVAARANHVVITVDVPLAAIFDHANAIRSPSKGRASYAMTLSRFVPVPAEIARQVLGNGKAWQAEGRVSQ